MDNNQLLITALICLISACFVMFLVWLWAKKIKNASIVDVFWALNFPLLTIIIFFLSDGYEVRKLLICSLFLIAELRLGLHLAQRVFKHIGEEEGRYVQLRKDWGAHANRNFFFFFQFQGISNAILILPVLIISFNKETQIHLIEYIGIAVWLLSFFGEMIADKQLASFKNNKDHVGKVCAVGLWRYSRHPNYFFEWLTWVSYLLIALASPFGALAIISPAIMLYLLLKVTGVPNNEEQNLRSKPIAYKAYQKSTSAFIPLPPRK